MEKNKINIGVIGDIGVGKTSILEKLTSNIFNDYHDLTLGIELYFYDYKGYNCIFHDTAGMEKYKSITQQLYQTMEIFIIVYDLSLNISSAEQTAYWIDSIYKNCGIRFPQIIFIGNKLDKTFNKPEIYLSHLVCSAKTGENIHKIFDYIDFDLLESNRYRSSSSGSFYISMNKTNDTLTDCCFIL